MRQRQLSTFYIVIMVFAAFFLRIELSCAIEIPSIKETAVRYGISGASVIFLHRNRILGQRSYGSFDEKTTVPIGALSEVFLAAVIASLVDEGKVAFDAPIKNLYPSLKLKDPYITKNITIRDVLAHRSGNEKFYPSLFRLQYHPDEMLIPFVEKAIENKEKSSYQQVLSSRILTPLKMLRTQYNNNEIVSTAEDLSHFVLMLINDGYALQRKILRKGVIDQMLYPAIPLVDIGIKEKEGAVFHAASMGWHLKLYRGVKVAERISYHKAVTTFIAWIPQRQLAVVVAAMGSAEGFSRVIANSFFDQALRKKSIDWLERFWGEG